MTSRADRLLPNWYIRHFLCSHEEKMESYSLRMILRTAELEEYIHQLPPSNKRQKIKASEYAALHAAIRSYYGNGARGSLIRIGRSVWNRYLAESVRGRILYFFSHLFLPVPARGRLALGMVAYYMKQADSDVSVHLLDTDFIFMDKTSDITFGQVESQPICWFTVGMIRAAMSWATDAQMDVEEISCRAVGAEACKFRIYSG